MCCRTWTNKTSVKNQHSAFVRLFVFSSGNPFTYLIFGFRLLHHIVLLPAQQMRLQPPDHRRKCHPHQHRTITATIIPDASALASDSMIKRPIPRSAPMNSPTMMPISAKEIAGESEANTQAIVDGITTVRVICHLLAPSSRATLTKPSSIDRAANSGGAPANQLGLARYVPRRCALPGHCLIPSALYDSHSGHNIGR